MNFWCDNNLSWRIASALATLLPDKQHTILHIRDDPRFSHKNNEWGSNTTLDTEWIPVLGKDNIVWNVISGDSAILTRDTERELLAESGLTFFYVDKYFANAKLFEKGRRLIWLWPELLRCAAIPGPAVYKIITGPKQWSIEPELFGRRSLGDLRDNSS